MRGFRFIRSRRWPAVGAFIVLAAVLVAGCGGGGGGASTTEETIVAGELLKDQEVKLSAITTRRRTPSSRNA